MPQSSSKSLDNLPYQFKVQFANTFKQIKEFGDAVLMLDFSTLANSIYFFNAVDQNERELADNARNWLYRIFSNDKTFVDKNLSQLENRKDEFVQNLYAQGIVFLWSRLESHIRQLLSELIKYNSNILDKEYPKNISNKIHEYKRTNSEDALEALVRAIIDNQECKKKYGAERYECILKDFNLIGNIEERLKIKISELYFIRNCIVHHNFLADKKLVESCYWLNYKIGEKITIQHKDFRDYENSILIYIMEIFYRLNSEFGAPKEFLEELRTKINNLPITQ